MPTRRAPSIDEDIIDAPTQRFWAAAFFFAFQAYKTSDFLTLFRTEHTLPSLLAVKWIVLDILFLVLLHYLRIPWLDFGLGLSVGLAALFSCFNLLIFIPPIEALTTLIFAILNWLTGGYFSRQWALSDNTMVKVDNIIYNSSHLLGSHTIHYLPHSTAKLNPENRCFCFGKNDARKDILVPILFNNTKPFVLALSRVDFETGAQDIQHLTYKHLQKATNSSYGKHEHLYYLKLRKPGVYKLSRIMDKDKNDIRLYRGEAIVVPCPQASLLTVPRVPVEHSCLGNNDASLTFIARGLPPLMIEYHMNVDGKSTAATIDSIQPDDYQSPLHGSIGSELSANDYTWGKSVEVTRSLNLTFEYAADHVYTIKSVKDGCGNIMHYLPPRPEHEKKFIVHPTPSVIFAPDICDVNYPVKLLRGRSAPVLPIKFKNSKGPFEVDMKYRPNLNSAVGENIHLTSGTPETSFKASRSGLYELVSVKDSWCQGIVKSPASCTVVEPSPPSVIITDFPIQVDCFGEVGSEVVMEFSGLPPFTLHYRIIKDGRQRSEYRESVDKLRHVMKLEPRDTGSYLYEFYSLEDQNYDKVPVDKSIRQIVHPRPTAAFKNVDRKPIRVCTNDTVSLDVMLTGNSPLTIYWTVLFDTVRNVFSQGNLTQGIFTIESPPLDIGGNYVVELSKVEDANKCEVQLQTDDVVIDVRAERPSVSFQPSLGILSVLEGSNAALPLRLSGEKPFKVEYQINSQKSRRVTINDLNGALLIPNVRVNSTIELLSVEDDICPGYVNTPPKAEIQLQPRPSLVVSGEGLSQQAEDIYTMPDKCEGTESGFVAVLSGKSPWHVSYEHLYRAPGTKKFNKLSAESFNSGYAKKKVLAGSIAGEHRYVFNGIADDHYEQMTPIQGPIVEQTVYSIPNMQITNIPDRRLYICSGAESRSLDPLHLKLSGQPPFDIELVIRAESREIVERIVHNNIMSKSYDIYLPAQSFQQLGKYEVLPFRMRDAHNCSFTFADEEPDSGVVVEVMNGPTISPITAPMEDVCVGDFMEYTLTGQPPFIIRYEFNGRLEEVELSGTLFRRIADLSGNFTLISLEDSRKCRVTDPSIRSTVHELPSAIMSGGTEIIENIKEGDRTEIIVKLLGTPPFTFTFTRSESIRDPKKATKYIKGAVLERETVTNVQSHQYSIFGALEGTWEVVFVKDYYCSYPKISV